MRRALTLSYGVACYLAFVAVFVALGDFVANLGYVRGMDTGPGAPLLPALATNLGLVAIFGATHSVMARSGFKAVWTRVVAPCVERSTYVLVAALSLALVVWQWRAMPALVWNVESPLGRTLLWVISGAGVVLVVVATFLTSHFDLFGLRQVFLHARGIPYSPVPFQERGLYRRVRHPMMLGVLLWVWSTPSMSVGHIVFAGAMSLYIAVGITLEERGLVRELGAPYVSYRARVRALLPFPRGPRHP